MIPKKDLDEIKNIFSEDYLINTLEHMADVAWDYQIDKKHIKRWLSNFNGDVLGDPKVEKIVALWLLTNYTLYTDREVRAMCKCMYEDYIHSQLLAHESEYAYIDINNLIQTILNYSIFLPLGNPSESGTSILYYFRQENNLNGKYFSYDPSKRYKNVIYIDDMTLSGKQASDYIKDSRISSENVYLLTFLATERSIERLKKDYNQLNIICVSLLDDRNKCFSDESFIFSGDICSKLKDPAYLLCEHYGSKIFNKNSLGFDNGQYVFGFHYNTPNNTLPIMWGNTKFWTPAFHRYNKNSNFNEVKSNDSKYV